VVLDLKNPSEEWARVTSWPLNVKCLNVGGLLRLCCGLCSLEEFQHLGPELVSLESWFRNLIILNSFKFWNV
jgi:hypothetical protein